MEGCVFCVCVCVCVFSVCVCVSEGCDAEAPVHHVLCQALEELSGAVERLTAFSEGKHGVTLLPRRSA